MTQEEFVARYRYRLAGLALYGSVSEAKDGPLKRAEMMFAIPEKVEELLRLMYADMNPKPKPPARPGTALETKT